MKTQINKQTQWQTQNANNIQIRIVARKKRILDDDVVITQDNIQHIGEIIAVATIKTVMCRSGKNLYWLYDGLIQDCKRSNDVNHTYSDGYDIAQTAMLFLCEHKIILHFLIASIEFWHIFTISEARIIRRILFDFFTVYDKPIEVF